MGQTHNKHQNPIFQDWQQHPTLPNTYINKKQNIQVQSIQTILLKNQQIQLQKRLQDNYKYFMKIYYYQPIYHEHLQVNNKNIGQDNRYNVYIQKMYPVSTNFWNPITSALSILKGFRKLRRYYGAMRVTPNMIRINNKKQIRVWINQNPLKNQPIQKIQNQQIMLVDIVKFIIKYDNNIVTYILNCHTIDQAIHNILNNQTENKVQINLSNRTNNHNNSRGNYNRNQDKSKSIIKKDKDRDRDRDIVGNQMLRNPKNNFRLTKQTTSDEETNNNYKYNSKKQINSNLNNHNPNNPNFNTNAPQKNYLQNVTVSKLPTYINIDKNQFQYKNTAPIDFRNSDCQSTSRQYNNYSQPNQNNNNVIQKQSSIQFNNSYPVKNITSPTRNYKPIEFKNYNFYDNNSNASNKNNSNHNQIYASYQKNSRDPQRYTDKYTDILQNKASQYTYIPQRKSNINKNYLQRLENSQDFDPQQYRNKTTMNLNQKSEINTLRDFMDYHSFTRPRYVETNAYLDTNRTKTQQFYSTNTNFQQLGCSPRNRTNYFPQNQPINKPTNLSNINKPLYSPPPLPPPPGITSPSFQKSPFQKSQSLTSKQKQNFSEYQQQDEKKQIKMKQAQRIKQEMGSLGILGLNKPLLNDKSGKDLLIKQKIEQKNKKHQDLKYAITMLLNR